MEGSRPARLRRGKSFSAERLLGASLPLAPPLSSARASTSSAAAVGDELNEDDFFWTGDYTADGVQHNHQPSSSTPPSSSSSSSSPDPWHHLRKASPVGASESFGVLAALPENEPRSVFNHKASISSPTSSSASSSASSSRMISIPTVPKPPPERLLQVASSSSGSRYHRSAPVNVPAFPPLMLRRCREIDEIDDDYDEDGEGTMLPPHEIVARSLARSPMIACSVLEGAGRTLKGRDLRQVRNAIFRQTGFLD
ncbi:hypothetical protein BT93_H3061 [Corymbia citriodora subsp. variegata]|nr:hypothetical protein BT93_H3061 [Corymbia citriodora subsp. variegata]